MASFFQPAVFDPNSKGDVSGARSPNTGFLIYTNSILPTSNLLATWYQFVVFGLGAAFFCAPLLRWTVGGVIREARKRKRRKRTESPPLPEWRAGTPSDRTEKTSKDSSARAIKSFGLFLSGDIAKFLNIDYDAHIVEFGTCMAGLPSIYNANSGDTTSDSKSKNIWGLVSRLDWNAISSSEPTVLHSIDALKQVTAGQGLCGLVVSSTIDIESQLSVILDLIVRSGVPCILLDDASEPAKGVDLQMLSGVIYKNACILTNGSRRDFFQAAKLRSMLGRCDRHRARNKNFFVGFLDRWTKRPLPAVVRRSYKFALFHGAVFSHAAEDEKEWNGGSAGNSLSAFDWIKRNDIVQAQKLWMSATKPRGPFRTPAQAGLDVTALESVLPGISTAFRQIPVPNDISDEQEDEYRAPAYLTQAPPRNDFWTLSSQGKALCKFGCFDLREELFEEQYSAVVETQKHLQRLGMLEPLATELRQGLCEILTRTEMPTASTKSIFDNLAKGLELGSIKILRGLDSGFSLPGGHGHFWSVSHDDEAGNLYIYISLKAPDLISTVLHTYLAHGGLDRRARFEIELAIIQAQDGPGGLALHPRLSHELQTASYSELLFLVEQIMLSGGEDPLLQQIRTGCEKCLIESSSQRAWNKLHSDGLLSRKVSVREVLEARLRHSIKNGASSTPEISRLVALHSTLDVAIQNALFEDDDATLSVLSQPLFVSDSSNFNDSIDLYSLMFFSSLRRHAYEEVYMETTDRCPLFLQQHDQAAVFAELWVLGSQCEIYFGIRPRALGAIIYDEYRDYLQHHPPPPESWNGIDVFTAYHKVKDTQDNQMLIGSDGIQNPATVMPMRARLAKASFLTIFCVPAIVDVCLLTFLGRGMYLTAFMTLEERVMANYAVLSALILTAGVTGWSGSTGGFYLYQAAFHNMNHFMVQRISGGFILATILAISGFVAFGIEYSWYAGFIFAAYLMILSTFLNILGVMSTMHRDGTPFKSGRLVIGRCLLITLISPMLTSFVNGHDVLIYLVVLYVFLGVLIFSYARLCNEWSSWSEKIHLVKEQEIIEWYQTKATATVADVVEKVNKLAELDTPQTVIASACLMEAITSFLNKKSGQMGNDAFVKKLAEGHKYVVWLLEKESNGQPLPSPYSSTWLVQTKLALTNQQQLNRGLKEHSPFLTYRTAKYDLAQNVGLFLVALLDRWVAVSMSANGHVINMYYNLRARYGIAFGLLYFLLCAVSLDVVLQRYWGKTGRNSAEKLGNILDFEATENVEARIEKKRWLTAISELIWVMFCIFGLMTLLLWLMVSDVNQIILYFAYIVGYSAVILFQFNRVFTTDIKIHIQIVFMSAFSGYCLGIALHEFPQTQDFRFNDVIALCIASMTAALGTWLFTDFCDDPSQEVHVANEDMVNWKVYSQKLLGREESGCGIKQDRLSSLQGTEYHCNDRSKISDGIIAIFDQNLNQSTAWIHTTFERSKEMINFTLQSWSQEKLRLIVVDRSALISAGGEEVFAASAWVDDKLVVYVGMPAMNSSKTLSEEAYASMAMQISAEAMLHETCEALLHLSHADATLAELLLNGEASISTRMAVQLAWTELPELFSIIARTNAELLRHLALGIDVDVEWEEVPEEVRRAVISRIKGQRYAKSAALRDWLSLRSENIRFHDWYIRQCLGIREAAILMIEQRGAGESDGQASELQKHVWNSSQVTSKSTRGGFLGNLITAIYRSMSNFIEFVAIVSSAGTDCGRELHYVLRRSKARAPIVWGVLKIWKLCWWVKNLWIRLLLLSANPKYKEFHDWTVNGATHILSIGVAIVRDPRFYRTGFLVKRQEGIAMVIYEGLHSVAPSKAQDYQVANYDGSARLVKLIQVSHGPNPKHDVQIYQYPTDRRQRFPTSKMTHVGTDKFVISYDKFGRVTHGVCKKKDIQFQFTYDYKVLPKDNLDLLRATYKSINLQDRVVYSVFWCHATDSSTDDIQTFNSSGTFKRLTMTTDFSAEEITWTYEHKRDPIIVRRTFGRDGKEMQEPETLQDVPDELGILEKPTSISFVDEDILLFHSTSAIFKMASPPTSDDIRSSSLPKQISNLPKAVTSRWSPKSTKHVSRHYLSTATLRTALWKQWSTRTDMDAVTTCMLDELMLRKEMTLMRYWRLRDAGYFVAAKQDLAANLDVILSNIEISHDVSQKTSLAIKPGDLFVMGLSKDSNFVTSMPEDTYIDTDDRVAVIFTDTGCWPDAPGGVSNCRRDLIDGHKSVRNYALTESANEYGIPRFQIERSLQLIKNLPLWGLDGKSPCHGLFDNLLQMQVQTRIRRTKIKEDVQEIFVPLLKTVVRGARTMHHSKKDLFEYTNTFLNINKYFEENDYLTTWRSKVVRKAWREAWLCEYADDNISNPNESFQIERPTSKDFDEALELYISYFFIFSVRVPERVPRVFQSTHHGISSLYGMILKIRRGTTWGIWDHAIMWRESCLNISPAQCILPIAVQTMLLGAMKLAANLAYLHADVILPCTAVYNPVWEAELGTDQGRRSSQKIFERKIDPITNGISNMDDFKPVETIRTEEPTVVMLSNVQFIKDVKTAILAAGVIINDFGFKNYHLVVYGAQDRQPSYAIETEEMINNLGIGKTVRLGGFGSPKEVLKDAWLFMNSSLSEGLPLAIGEAALSGIPIVATEVGATAQVLTDVDDPNILYGEVVPPNDPVALARAQISLLAMVGPWARFTTDETPPSPLPTTFSEDDVVWLSERMHAKTEDRRKLGLKLRDVVLRKFNGMRYLREHEQMYWVQRHMASQRANKQLMYLPVSHPRFGEILGPKLVEKEDGETMWSERRWQDFGEGKKKQIEPATLRRNTIVDYGFRIYSNDTVRDLEAGDEGPVVL